MTTKILLDDRTELANKVIIELSQSYENGKKMLSLLAAIGIEKSEITDWQEIETLCKKDFPKATIQFNIEANGIEKEYKEAEAFYLKHRNSISYSPISEEEKEINRESVRIYADTPQQIEAYNLIMQTIDNLNRLGELGVKIDFTLSYQLHKVFESRYDRTPQMKPNKTYLVSAVKGVK